jgi:thiamine monophosphate synthase
MAAGAKIICAVRCITNSDTPESAIAELMAVIGGYSD